MQPIFCLPLILLACCGGSQQSTIATEEQGVLVAYSASASSQQGGGGSVTRIRIDADGSVWIARDSSFARCGTMEASRRATLETAVRQAMGSDLRDVYDTSTHPPPNANYSQTEALVLSLDGEQQRVRVDGWADVPPQLAAVKAGVNQAAAMCTAPQR